MLALYMNSLLPVEGATRGQWERAWGYRLQLAHAIADVTKDPRRMLLLARIARFESAFSEDVGRCVVNGKAGDRSAFQIVPRNDTERSRLCRSLRDDAAFALERVNESLSACRSLPERERLAVYARGSCASEKGKLLSRHRWPSSAAVTSFAIALKGR